MAIVDLMVLLLLAALEEDDRRLPLSAVCLFPDLDGLRGGILLLVGEEGFDGPFGAAEAVEAAGPEDKRPFLVFFVGVDEDGLPLLLLLLLFFFLIFS